MEIVVNSNKLKNNSHLLLHKDALRKREDLEISKMCSNIKPVCFMTVCMGYRPSVRSR